MKRILSTIMLILMVSVVHAGLAPSDLPESSYYQGRHSFYQDAGDGAFVTGRLEFAVYTGPEAENAISATGYEGSADYVYAYQVFVDQDSDAALAYFAVTGINPTTVDAQSIDAMEDFSDGGPGIQPDDTYGFNADLTKGIWEFNNTTLIQGEKSWFLFIYSDYDWIAGDIELRAIYDDDIPVPDGGETPVPEPATLALLAGGAVLSLTRRKQG